MYNFRTACSKSLKQIYIVIVQHTAMGVNLIKCKIILMSLQTEYKIKKIFDSKLAAILRKKISRKCLN